MAVPKRKVSKARKNTRRSNVWKLSAPAFCKCPQCGEEVEVFSNDISVKCSNCGFVVYNNIVSCVEWCKYAKECVGEETYRKIMAQKRNAPVKK